MMSDSANLPNGTASSGSNKPPNNLQQLLCLTTSLPSNNNNSTVNQIEEEEKRIFLQNALSSMTVDIGTRLQDLINTVSEIETDPDFSVEKYRDVLEEILDLVGAIDHANVFYQRGGLEVILPLLKHSDSCLQRSSASIIAECCKNNPFCQNLSTSTEVFLPLVEGITKDSHISVKQQAVSAISAIVRDNPRGVELLKSMNVLEEILGQGLSSQDERMFSKTVWLVYSLAHTSNPIKADLLRIGVIEKMIRRLHSDRTVTAEYVIQALISLVTYHEVAEEILRPDLQFTKYLENMYLEKNSDESFQDFFSHAKELLLLLKHDSLLA